MVGQDVACRHHGALGSWSESRIEGCDWPAVCADSDDEATILAALDLALIEREREQEPVLAERRPDLYRSGRDLIVEAVPQDASDRKAPARLRPQVDN